LGETHNATKKLKNGRWQVRYRDLEKKQRAQNFEKKKDAEDFITQLKHELRAGTYMDQRKGEVPLETFWPEWFQLKSGKKVSTQSDYESMWKVHIQPRWGKTPVSRIRQETFDAWVLSLKLSARRANKVHLLGSMLLDFVVDKENLKKNPLKNSKGYRNKANLVKIPKKQVGLVHTLEELFDIANCAGPFEDHILFLGLCGVRWGEFVALQVKDLDLKNGTVWVHQSYSEVNGKLVYSDSTKTHEDRLVYLIDFLLEKAPKWIEGKNPEDPLFASADGTLLRNSNFARRIYQPAMVAAGVTKKRIHDLRWTMISIAASKGLEQNMVREQAGHSKAYMTSAYTKVFKKDRHTGLAKLNSAVYEVHKKCIDPSDLAPKLKSKESRTLPIEGFIEWGGRGSNPRPTDYESAALTN